jgi:large subunit ribosomal protein L32
MSRRRKLMRRNHDKLSLNHLVRCDTCGSYKQSHHVCPTCGTYGGREVIDVSEPSAT